MARICTLLEADENDLAVFVFLHELAATWLWERGIKQWRPGEFTVDSLKKLLASGGEVYLGWTGGVPVGGFTLQWEDTETWGERPPDAGYLHSLCILREFAGLGIGASLLDDAGQRVAEAGRKWLRLDCWAGNDVLRAYYERQGFTLRAIAKEDDYQIALYERAATMARP